jgi:hypothetical protein
VNGLESFDLDQLDKAVRRSGRLAVNILAEHQGNSRRRLPRLSPTPERGEVGRFFA